MLPNLSQKLNLYSNELYEVYEDFCDHVTDHVCPYNEGAETYELLKVGEIVSLGARDKFNKVDLEAVSNIEIEASNRSDEMESSLTAYTARFGALGECIHSSYLMHVTMQEDIQIDIIWARVTADNSFSVVGMYWEDNGVASLDGEINYEPSTNANWEEILYVMGLGQNPFEPLDEE